MSAGVPLGRVKFKYGLKVGRGAPGCAGATPEPTTIRTAAHAAQTAKRFMLSPCSFNPADVLAQLWGYRVVPMRVGSVRIVFTVLAPSSVIPNILSIGEIIRASALSTRTSG